MATVKQRKLKWHGHVTRSAGLTKVKLQGTVKGKRIKGVSKKKWIDTITEWTGKSFADTRHVTQLAGVERADEKVHLDATLRLLAELRDQ